MIDLQRIWPFALSAVVLLAVVILVLLLALLRRSARASSFEDAEPEPEPEPIKDQPAPALPPSAEDKAASKGLAPLAVRLAFGRAGRRLDRAAAGDRHRVPFFLLLGGEGSRDSDLLANAGLELPFGAPAEAGTDLGQGRGFWFLDRGALLDLAGDAMLAADGRSSDEGSWRSTINLLQKLRPKRPVDGVILAIPCRELIEAQRSEAAQDELAARAGRIYRKLWQMQQRLGFRLPVYLLVTGCERLSGFGSFSGLVPPKLRDEMLGWSSPFGPDAAYRSGWVDDAFAALGKRMDDLQMEVFADTPAAADSLFLLPGAVRSLSSPVRVFLDQLFKPSAYHESLILRGIYCCGREEAGAKAEEGNTARRAFFLKDLLNEKAFREAGLAMPAARTVIARNRAVRFAQAAALTAALLLGGGLLWASYDLRHEEGLVEDFLGETLTHLRQVRQGDPQDIADVELKDWTLDLLAGMSGIDFGHFGSPFIPSSWFGPFHDRLQQAFTRSFEEIILQAISNELVEEARGRIDAAALQEAAPVLTVQADAPVQRIEEMPEFIAFQRYVKDMEEVEKKGRQFNKLRESRDLKPLGELVSFAFHERLPDSFYANSGLYLDALRGADYVRFDPSRFRADASWQAEKLAGNFFTALYQRNPLRARLERLALGLQMAAVQEPETGETRRFGELVRHMSDVESALSGTEMMWAFRRQFNLGPAVAGVRATMEGLAIFEPESPRRIHEAGLSGWTSFQHYLASVTAVLITGPILAVRDGRPEMQLSAETVLLQSALKTFLGMSFAAAPLEGHRIRTELPPGMRLVWDPILLDKATTVTAAFDRFREKGLTLLPADLRPTLERVALDRTNAQAVDLISRAQTFEPIPPAVSQSLVEDEVSKGIGTFQASRRPVDELMMALGRIRLEQPQRDLEAAVSSEANRLLREVDRLLTEEKVYEPRMNGFSWWDGHEPASPAAWGAKDPTGVQIYLVNTRTRIADLAQVKAQPLLTWLTRTSDLPHDVRALTDKWRGILDDIRGYESKKPGNPVLALEDFILNEMPKVDTRSCSSAVVRVQDGGGLFASNLLDLSRQLQSRCYTLAGGHAMELYQEAARYFNQRLAGRYPFTSKSPGPRVPEADPEDVRAFFKQFDRCQEVFRSVPAGTGQELRVARGFIDRIAKARTFFAPYLDAEKPELYPSFDIEANFRILREREVAANQIIGWTLEVGGDRITDRETESRKLRWTLGERVRLSVRWASDGPLMPVIRVPKAGVSVQERTVVYEYTNRWALLAALADNRAPLSSYGDEQPVTLALAVYTQPVDGSQGSEAPTEVFLRLTVLAPGTTQTLDPPSFPERAPLSDEVMVENVL
ncbi:MAG: type secretion system protein ImpL [Acidobacteriota bacterium]|nr:type secretion system protein ImpL [Acidobacteriota bacterium]